MPEYGGHLVTDETEHIVDVAVRASIAPALRREIKQSPSVLLSNTAAISVLTARCGVLASTILQRGGKSLIAEKAVELAGVALWIASEETDDKFYEVARDSLCHELVAARSKFPGNRFLLAALVEEVGELASAILQKSQISHIVKEAIQVACVAVRIAEEGDSSFSDITDAEAKP